MLPPLSQANDLVLWVRRSFFLDLCLLFNKLTSVFYTPVLVLITNCIITWSKWLRKASGSAVNFDYGKTKFINKRTDAQKTDVSLSFYNNKTTKWPNSGINEEKSRCKLAFKIREVNFIQKWREHYQYLFSLSDWLLKSP